VDKCLEFTAATAVGPMILNLTKDLFSTTVYLWTYEQLRFHDSMIG